MEHSDLCIGIDLGTTNSVIATSYMDGDRIETPVSRIERYTDMGANNNVQRESRDLLPSCVYYPESKNDIYDPVVGDFAKKVSATQPYAVAKSIKRQMGQPKVDIQGWKKEYPDQKPEEVSARILKHLIGSIEDYYDEKITDAVITVPASFNLAQREATLRAAELAGLDVRNVDGSYRDDILVSEPEAVIYDVLNQVQNGKINLPIDFSDKKRVLVFDIGGGTLDITLHEISKTDNGKNHFEIRPLATNRFSTVAGDRFDEKLAELMYNRYLDYYRAQNAEIAKRIEENLQSKIPFLSYAEELKLRISEQVKIRKKRGNPLSNDYSFDYGGYMPNGYTSEDSMTLEEFENTLSSLLGERYTFDDYKRFHNIRYDNNIIYPILDVLNKAAKKLGTEDVSIDAVILNGGMSRLYLIEKRLSEFFNLKPITVNDPDKSVAQGAAVYHHYLHQDEKAVELHRKFLEEQARLEHMEGGSAQTQDTAAGIGDNYIHSVSGVLNEAIYLGLKGGSTYLLADSGVELPYESSPLTNFAIAPGQTSLRIPIKQATANGEYRTIASGDIIFKQAPKYETGVAISFHLHKNGTLTLEARTHSDRDGADINDRGSVTLNFNTSDIDLAMMNRGRKALPPAGTKLVVANELSSFKSLVHDLKKSQRNQTKKRNIIKNLNQKRKTITNCGNPEEFAAPSLKMLRDAGDPYMDMNYLGVARQLSRYWTQKERELLSRYCVDSISHILSGWPDSGLKINANIQAIKTIGVCGVPEDISKLKPLEKDAHYRDALLYAFGYAGQEAEWILKEYQNDLKGNNDIHDSLRAIDLIFSGADCGISWEEAQKALSATIELVENGQLEQKDLILACIALGEIGARTPAANDPIVQKAKQTLDAVPSIYGGIDSERFTKVLYIAKKLIGGSELSDNDEAYIMSIIS